MKSLVQINTVCNGSTGKIMNLISDEAIKNNFRTYNFYGRGKLFGKNNNKIGNEFFAKYIHGLLSKFGLEGYGSYFSTKRLIRKLKKINPDIIHLHNLHGHYLNYKVLFNYLKNDYKGKIIWTLHDCWSFTGGCYYFDYPKCDKWKIGCKNCKNLSKIKKCVTKKIYNMKKNFSSEINDMTIITPSKWLANLVSQSFLKEYKIKVINNGIDLNIFKKYSKKELEEIYKKYSIPKDKKIILGIAGNWGKRKGIDDFIELSKTIGDDYIILMVGVNEQDIEYLTKKEIRNTIFIKRTDNQIDLAKLYNIADIYFNPTYEDNYPTVNLESVACGTPVITYNTGGSPESMLGYGVIATKDEMLKNYEELIRLANRNVLQNKVKSGNDMIKDYIDIYNC